MAPLVSGASRGVPSSLLEHAPVENGRKLQAQCHQDKCGIYCGPPRPPPCGNSDGYGGDRDDYYEPGYDNEPGRSDDRPDSTDTRYETDMYGYPSQDKDSSNNYYKPPSTGYTGPAYNPAADANDYPPLYDEGSNYGGGDQPYGGGEKNKPEYSDNYNKQSSEYEPPSNSDDYPDPVQSDSYESDDGHREPGCYGSMPFGLDNCLCDGAEIGEVAGTAACGRVFTECQGMAPFHVEDDGTLGAIQRTCDTLALDACIGSAQSALVQNPGCAELLRFGTPKCTPGQASKIFNKSVKRQCKPLCKSCVRHP